MATGPIKATNPVTVGTFSPNSGVTLNELRVRQTGKVAEVHFYATVTNTSTNLCELGYVQGVNLPPTIIRTITGTGNVAYEANHPAYLVLGSQGGMSVFRSQASDKVINVDLVYTVD